MVPRPTLVNRIRELNYHLHQETQRVHIYRKRGSNPPHYVTIRKCDKLEDEFVRSTLNQVGLKQEEIEKFIAEYKCHP
jgi:hypothetical protein